MCAETVTGSRAPGVTVAARPWGACGDFVPAPCRNSHRLVRPLDHGSGGRRPRGLRFRHRTAPKGRPLQSRPPVALLDRAIARLLPAVPRPVVQRLSGRYIAGPELKDARAAVRRLNAEGKLATIDVLGEEIASEEDAAVIVDDYRDVFADIERCGLD